MDAVITAIHDAGGIRVLELRSPDGAPLPLYEAGAHIDVTLGNGLVRQYSLCCRAPSGESYRIAVKREPQSRGGSAWLHDTARVGGTLGIGTPRNAFALAPAAPMHLLFAGGIGITPVLSMAYALLRRGERFRLAYFTRDEASIAFADELRGDGALAQHTDIHCGHTPSDRAARIAQLLNAAPTGAHAYVCGPGPFMEAVTQAARARLGPDAVHQESFTAPAPDAGAQTFILRLARSGRDITVPAGSTALVCLQDAGIAIDSSCEVGVCGTCRTTVLQGVPDHQDSVLTAPERAANNCFLPCVSRARTPVMVLDI
ncbi:PDR/VanB family oxidoreductase [Oxalobacteraceae bacterium A2-2]